MLKFSKKSERKDREREREAEERKSKNLRRHNNDLRPANLLLYTDFMNKLSKLKKNIECPRQSAQVYAENVKI